MNRDITFHIDNMAYTLNIDTELEKEMNKFLPKDKTLSTKELLYAYICKCQEHYNFKEEISKISDKLPEV